MKQYALAYKLPLPRERIVTNTCDANPLSNKFHILALNQLGSHGVHLMGGREDMAGRHTPHSAWVCHLS